MQAMIHACMHVKSKDVQTAGQSLVCMTIQEGATLGLFLHDLLTHEVLAECTLCTLNTIPRNLLIFVPCQPRSVVTSST